MPVSSQDFAHFAIQGRVDPQVIDAARPAIVDTLAAMIAGSPEPVVTRLAAATQAVTGDQGVSVIGLGARYRADEAALIYGTAAHALDYDDVSMLAICHPSAPVLSALLAAAPWDTVDGNALCEAHAIGTEAMIRMGQAIGIRHFEIGFHATATLGLFGAVVAVARLRRLDPETTHTSLAIAASMAGGMRLNFGTDVKPLHVGLAASNAIKAVDWAVAGLSASHADLFAPEGILATLSGRQSWGWPEDINLGQPFAIADPGFERKRFPGCYMLHKIMALGIEIAQEQIGLAQIGRIDVIMPRGGTRPLIHPAPTTGKEGLFSIPYAVLAAINEGDVSFTTFSNESVGRADIRERFRDVFVTEAGEELATSEELGAAPVRIVLQLTNGTSRTFERTAAPGSPQDPMTAAQMHDKWVDCLRRANPAIARDSASDFHARAQAGLHAPLLSSWLPDLWQLAATQNPFRKRALS